MKPMIWKPEANDYKINEYLDRGSHAPYELIFSLLLGLFCLFTFMVIVGTF